MKQWPFADPENVAVFTTRSIVRDKQPILLVTHDADDGSWQFHEGGTPEPRDAMIVSLREMYLIDPTIAQLTDLPLGWHAWRRVPGDPWQRVVPT